MHVQLSIEGVVSTARTIGPCVVVVVAAITALNTSLSVVINVPKARDSYKDFKSIISSPFRRTPKNRPASPLVLSSISKVDPELDPDFTPEPPTPPLGGAPGRRNSPQKSGNALPAYIRDVISGGKDRTIDSLLGGLISLIHVADGGAAKSKGALAMFMASPSAPATTGKAATATTGAKDLWSAMEGKGLTTYGRLVKPLDHVGLVLRAAAKWTADKLVRSGFDAALIDSTV